MYVSYNSRNQQWLLSSKSPLADMYKRQDMWFEQPIQHPCQFVHFHGNTFCKITITWYLILMKLLYMSFSCTEKNSANLVTVFVCPTPHSSTPRTSYQIHNASVMTTWYIEMDSVVLLLRFNNGGLFLIL